MKIKHITNKLLSSNDKKKTIYVCSPLAGEIEKNIQKAREYSKFVAEHNGIPIAPHITELFNDEIPEERNLGLQYGMDLLKKADVIYVFGDYISSGMRNEINYALQHNIPIYQVDTNNYSIRSWARLWEDKNNEINQEEREYGDDNNKLLAKRVSDEFETYKNENLSKCTISELWERADEISTINHIVTFVTGLSEVSAINDETVELLLDQPNTISYLYDTWLDSDLSRNQEMDSLLSIAFPTKDLSVDNDIESLSI